MTKTVVCRREGFTLVEAIVSIAVVGLLVALLFPAIQSARSTARRTVCQNHLRQVGVALGNSCEVSGVYPTTAAKGAPVRRLLPYLDAKSLADDLDAGRTPASYLVPVLACPDDAEVAKSMPYGGNSSYYYNAGVMFRAYDGFCKSFQDDLSPADIHDGQSQTVAMSERLVFPADMEPAHIRESKPRRYFWWTRAKHGPGEEALAVEECLSHRATTTPQFYGIQTWGYLGDARYNHLLPPNRPACYNGPESTAPPQIDLFVVSASSLHPQGVNSLFADGSVHFMSDLIDGAVWKAVGTRAGRELTTVNF